LFKSSEKYGKQILEETGEFAEYFEALKKREAEHPEKLVTKEQLKSLAPKVENA
jgi:hypothetical protein